MPQQKQLLSPFCLLVEMVSLMEAGMAADGYLAFFLSCPAVLFFPPVSSSSFEWRLKTALQQKWSILGCLAWPGLFCPSMGTQGTGNHSPENLQTLCGIFLGSLLEGFKTAQ